MRFWFQKCKKEGKIITEMKQTPLAPTPWRASPRPCSPLEPPCTRLSRWACWSQFLGWDCWKSKDTSEAHNLTYLWNLCLREYAPVTLKNTKWPWLSQTFLIASEVTNVLVILAARGSRCPTTPEFLAGAAKDWALQTEDRDPGPRVPGFLLDTRLHLGGKMSSRDLSEQNYFQKKTDQKTRL